MLIVGFGNKARHGKDTVANAIKTAFRWDGVNVNVIKFATALYGEVNQWLKQTQDFGDNTGNVYFVTDESGVRPIPNWVQPEPNAEKSELAPYGKHPKLLQWWGTDYRRSQDPDYWVKKTFATIPSNTDIALVTDVRFPNEADGIKQRGGYNINVQRLRSDGSPFVADDRPADHISETALDGYNWDFYIKSKHKRAAEYTAVALIEMLRDDREVY